MSLSTPRSHDPVAYEDLQETGQTRLPPHTVVPTSLAVAARLRCWKDELWSPTRLVIIQFPDMESAKRFAESEEYAPVKAIRHANADCTLAILEGV